MRPLRAVPFVTVLMLFAGQFTACVTGPATGSKRSKGFVLDDTQGQRKGPWVEATDSDVRYLGSGFLRDNNTNKGEVSIVYTPEIPETGDFEIILLSPPRENGARNVPVTIAVQDGAKLNLLVDQRNQRTKGFATLGTFRLTKGKLITVTVSNTGTVGCVVADGIQFVPVKRRSPVFR